MAEDARASPTMADEDDGDQNTDMPLTMAQSLVLSSLPKDASAALKGAGELPQIKGKINALTRRMS